MRGVAGIALVVSACSFDSGGQASSTSIGAATSSETSSASTDPLSSTDEATGGPTSTGDGDTSGLPNDGSSDGPTDDETSSDVDTTTTTDLDSSSTSEPIAEICNGVDDDGDGAVDEYSARNSSCGSCVYVVTKSGVVQSYCTDAVTWPEALQRCVDLGASLATIHSTAENDEVFAATAGANAWLGLSDAEREDDWEWHDDSALDFTAWEPGQPNDLGDEDCGHMRAEAGTWNDDECTNPHSYVCRGAQ
jgi:hypothetical protein